MLWGCNCWYIRIRHVQPRSLLSGRSGSASPVHVTVIKTGVHECYLFRICFWTKHRSLIIMHISQLTFDLRWMHRLFLFLWFHRPLHSGIFGHHDLATTLHGCNLKWFRSRVKGFLFIIIAWFVHQWLVYQEYSRRSPTLIMSEKCSIHQGIKPWWMP